jgi:hypothetical protein
MKAITAKTFRLILVCAVSGVLAFAVASHAESAAPIRLPQDIQPTLGAWFAEDDILEPDAFRDYVDLYADHSPYDLLPTSFRLKTREVTDPGLHDIVKKAVEYARDRGLRVALDLDVRLARDAFRRAYPDEQQEMLRLRTTPLSEAGNVELAIASDTFGDHMTGSATPYIPLSGRLVRVYSYVVGDGGIDPDTVQDITGRCLVKTASENEVRTVIPCDASTQGHTACVLVAFTHFTPDVYAPHLFAFQRAIVQAYADVPLAGLMKDEWGFPPCFDGCPPKNDFWFSKARAEAYAEATGGRDLVRDCLLMHAGERGRERERQAAINVLLKTSRERNAAVEDDYYHLAKEFFGANAAVVTHATWISYPDAAEYKKNGLSWWAATRDWGQTDEYAPFPVRTALAKKWGGSVWYNQFYSPNIAEYEESLWTHALGGGRIDYHPIYPNPLNKTRHKRNAELLEGGLMRGESRIRLIPAISHAPIDCPAAVLFGHACTMNWAGPAYEDAGLGVTDALWQAGYYADLIPSSEIASGAVKIDATGAVVYGAQRYAAVVLYHPEFENPETAAFFNKVDGARTALFRVGAWTRDFQAKDFDGVAALPASMAACSDGDAAAAKAIETLRARELSPCTPAASRLKPNHSVCPGREGRIRLTDGTEVLLAGSKNVAGDPIAGTFDFGGHPVTADATGVLALRFAGDGAIAGLAAGGLRHFEGGGISLYFDTAPDIAFWRDAEGHGHGLLQDWSGPVPESLLALTKDWTRLSVPAPAN